jgi:hypothetical protein
MAEPLRSDHVQRVPAAIAADLRDRRDWRLAARSLDMSIPPDGLAAAIADGWKTV